MVTIQSFWFVIPTHLKEIAHDVGWGNGYVAVYRGHPYWGKDMDEVDLDAHGGITYSRDLKSFFNHTVYGKMVKDYYGADRVDELRPEDWWVFGFDTAHLGDYPGKWPKWAVEDEARRLKAQLDAVRARTEILP